MKAQHYVQLKYYFTAAIALMIWGLLIWQHTHDGVPSHHFLHRADFPAISNWWGAILLPGLSWLVLGRIQQRHFSSDKEMTDESPKSALIGFIAALCYGGALSIAFYFGKPELAGVLFQGLFVLSVFFKLYREQFILGFVISMSFVFGAVLPMIFATLIALWSAFIFNITRAIYSKIRLKLKASQTS